MIKGAYSEKYKVVNRERFEKLKEEGSEETTYWKERTRELSRETNRRRRALEDKKRKKEADEERERKDKLAQRRKEQQEATQRFQKKNSHKRKSRRSSGITTPQLQDQSSNIQDGVRVIGGHVVEIQNGQQVLQEQRISPVVGLDEALRLVHNYSSPTAANHDPTLKYRNVNGVVGPGRTLGTKHSTCNGDLDPSGSRLMHSGVADTNHGYFHVETASPVSKHNVISDFNQNFNPLYNGVDKFEAEKLRVAEQERLRQEAFGKNAAPKLALMNYGSNQELTEGALPTAMGRNSPAGSLTSLDSLDEVPQNVTVATGSAMTPSTQPGIITKTKKANSAGRRRVKFCDSIEFDDGVVGQLVTHEKQSTKHYINLYNQSLAQQQSNATPELVDTTPSVLEPSPLVVASTDPSATSSVSGPRTSSAQNLERNSPKVRNVIMGKNNGVTTHADTQKEPINATNIPSFSGGMPSNPAGISILKRTAPAVPTQEGTGQNKASSLQADGTPRATVKYTGQPMAGSLSAHHSNSRNETQGFVDSSAKNQLIRTPSTLSDEKRSIHSSNSVRNSYTNAYTRIAEPNTLDCGVGSTLYTSPLSVGSSGSSVQDSLEILRDSLDESDGSVQEGTSNDSPESCPARERTSDGAQVELFTNPSSASRLPAQHSNRELSHGPESTEYNHGNISPIDSVPSPYINHVTFSSPAGVAIPACTNSSNYLPSSHSQPQNFLAFESHPTYATDSSIVRNDGTSLHQEGNVSYQVSTVITVADSELTTSPQQYNALSNDALYFQSWHPRSAASSTGASRMYSHSVVNVPAMSSSAQPVPLQSSVLQQTTTKPSYISQIASSQNQGSSVGIFGSSTVSARGQVNPGLSHPSSTVLTAGKQTSTVVTTLHSPPSSNVTLDQGNHELSHPLSFVQSSHTATSNLVDSKNNNKIAWFVDGSKQVPLSDYIPNENRNVSYNAQTRPENPGHLATGKTRVLQKGPSASKKPPSGAKPISPKQPTVRLARDKTGKQFLRKKAPNHNSRAKSSSQRHMQKGVRVNKKDQNTVAVDDDQVMKSIMEDMDKISLQSRLNSAQSLVLSPGPDQEEHDYAKAQYTQENHPESTEFDNQLNTHEPRVQSRIYSASRRVHNPGAVSAMPRTRQSITQQNYPDPPYSSESQRRVHTSDRRTVTDSSLSNVQRSQSAGYIPNPLGPSGYMSRPGSEGVNGMHPIASPSNHRTSAYVPYTAGVEAWSANSAPHVSIQTSHTHHANYPPPSHLKHSVSLDRTPTDDEINYLWDRVRVCLNHKSTQSAGSDSCVNRIDVRRSRTASGPVMPSYQHTVPYGYVKGSTSATPTGGFNNTVATPTLRRYGSYDGLRRYGSNDSINMRRSSLLRQRAARAAGPPYPHQQQLSPAPSRQGPAQTASTRVARGQQPLSEAEMRAVMKASQTNQRRVQSAGQGDQFNEQYQQQQYLTSMGSRKAPSALSMEEHKLLESLDRLNERLRVQQAATDQLTQKARAKGSSPSVQQRPHPPPPKAAKNTIKQSCEQEPTVRNASGCHSKQPKLRGLLISYAKHLSH